MYRGLFEHLRPSSGSLIIIFLLTALSIPFALFIPMPLKIAVDTVLGEQPPPGIVDMLVPSVVPRSPLALLILAVVLHLVLATLSHLRGLALGSSLQLLASD